YINSEVVVDREDIQEEYKVYAEEENKDIPMYIDETLDELLIDLEEGTSVFVNEVELTETTEEYIYVSLNEEIPEELEAELEDKEVVVGFVHVDRLVALDKEDEFLLKRENDTQEDATNDEQDNEFSDRKSTRLNTSHVSISYAVFCLKKSFKVTTHTHIYTLSLHDARPISLNEEIPEELEAELEDKEVVEGFVHVDRLVALDKEDEFLLKRENDTQEDATNDEQDNEF